MPTGYTAKLYDGEQDFKDFAIHCARAFNFLACMRDVPNDTPVPDKIRVDDYFLREIENEKQELERIKQESPAEYNERRYQEKFDEYLKSIKDMNDLRVRYNIMLDKVNNWNYPSEFSELKDFMISQLQESIKYDVWDRNDKPSSNVDYYSDAIKSCEDNIKYYQGEHQKVVDRANENNRLLKLFKESLA